jgi:single-strand DNA-binding protein
MFHRVVIIGFVGQDPQMRYAPDSTPVTNFSVATRQVVSKERVAECPQGWKESLNGKNRELTTGFRATAWRKLAEAVNQYLEKGSQIFVEGELRGDASDSSQNPRIWQGKD